jgi:hypothetical protein
MKLDRDQVLKLRDEMGQAFEDGPVSSVSAERLELWLRALCTGAVPNTTVQHREVIRGLTINHIQMARTIGELESTMRNLNRANGETQRLVIRLTKVAICLAVVQAIAAVVALLFAFS